MDIIPANVTYNLTIAFLVCRESVNLLNKYSFHTENNLFDVKKHIFCVETVNIQYIN